jgi:hypothetical protein
VLTRLGNRGGGLRYGGVALVGEAARQTAVVHTSRDVGIDDVHVTSLKTPVLSLMFISDEFVTIWTWSLWSRHIWSSVTKW